MSRLNYVLVKKAQAIKLGKEFRQNIGSYCLLDSSDFNNEPGEFLFERVEPYGGRILKHDEALALLTGTKTIPEILTENLDKYE